MSRQSKWRGIACLIALVLSLLFLTPSLSEKLPGWWGKILPQEKIHLGLDLQGGMHLILEVESQAAVSSTAETLTQSIRAALREKKIPFAALNRLEESSRIEIVLLKEELVNQVKDLLKERFTQFVVVDSKVDAGRHRVILDVEAKAAEEIKKRAVEQALQTIRNRVDQFGVSEPEIRPQGDNRILIQLPGVQDPQRAKALIGRTAQLVFKLVDEEGDVSRAVATGVTPPESELLYEQVKDKETGRVSKKPYLVKKRTLLTGRYITEAKVQIDQQLSEPYVLVSFDPQGAKLFEEITGANVKRRLAIILDDKINSAPVIQERIGGGTARITGHFTMEDARDLAIVLRAGALPAPVKVLEERTVGASLGADSIRQGLNCFLIASILVVGFMIFYYRVGGMVADLGLIINMMMLLAGLAAFKGTLTLPGIAGIVLTIGMAVDANVLIHERMREELRLGKTPKAAVEAGFDKATWTIIDSNLTTLFAGLVLFQFGTGPVRGFAVTLSLGILTTLFSSLVFARLAFDYLVTVRRIRKLSV